MGMVLQASLFRRFIPSLTSTSGVFKIFSPSVISRCSVSMTGERALRKDRWKYVWPAALNCRRSTTLRQMEIQWTSVDFVSVNCPKNWLNRHENCLLIYVTNLYPYDLQKWKEQWVSGSIIYRNFRKERTECGKVHFLISSQWKRLSIR